MKECKGKNCKSVIGAGHSKECEGDHEACFNIKMTTDYIELKAVLNKVGVVFTEDRRHGIHTLVLTSDSTCEAIYFNFDKSGKFTDID